MNFKLCVPCLAGLFVLCVASKLLAQPTLPDFGSAVFSNSTTINNPLFPRTPGTIATFHSRDIDPDTGDVTPQLIITEVLRDTRTVAGVTARIVRDQVFESGRILEDTVDWYAQDDNGNVWYLGEFVNNFEYDPMGNLIGTNHAGSWEAGVNGAQPGYIMPANPVVGDHYYQEFYPGIAVDEAEVTGTNQSFVVPYGTFSSGVLRTRDTTVLETDHYTHKFYAPGVGSIAERGFTIADNTLIATVDRNPESRLPQFDPANFASGATIDNPYFPIVPGRVYNYDGQEFDPDTGETMVLGYQEVHTARTRDIAGITTQIIDGFEYHDGLLIEDSEFYYAQDQAGNVWWMGEFSTKYEYDENGNLIGTNNDSSWYAGVNEARPGYYMPGDPDGALGESFYEIFAPLDGDIDTMELTTLDETVLTVLGNLSDVAIVLEKSDFSPGFAANKYYAPGFGLIRVREDFDTAGNPRILLDLTSIVPEPSMHCLFTMACAIIGLRHRTRLPASSCGKGR